MPRLAVALVAAALVPASSQAAPSPANHGIIRGVVLNGSRTPPEPLETTVVLRARTNGGFAVVAKTVADYAGRFSFEGLPVDPEIQYLPGANQSEVHYPGPRLRLSAAREYANVQIVVYDTVAGPSPLVVNKHDVSLRPGAGALEVTETLIVENPSKTCYVGESASVAERAVTLELGIPANFTKVVFDQEFFGRNFALLDGKLVTNMPWPPGSRRLAFTYVTPVAGQASTWLRRVDLPCSELNVTVVTERPDAVRCNWSAERRESDGTVVFSSNDPPLRAGSELRLNVSDMSRPLMTYGRWGALIVLGALCTGVVVIFRRRPASPRIDA